MLKHNVDFNAQVNWSGRHETPAGEVPGRPAESECLVVQSTATFNRD